MRKEYTIYWRDAPDGYTGNTQVIANCKQEVEQYFKFNFARFGFVLLGIE